MLKKNNNIIYCQNPVRLRLAGLFLCFKYRKRAEKGHDVKVLEI